MEHRRTADSEKVFRVTVYIDVPADTEDDAKTAVSEMIHSIPNSYIGETFDRMDWLSQLASAVIDEG